MLPEEFVSKWTKASLKESAASQEHFLDICHLLGHPTPAEVDSEGTYFTFQKGAKKTAGGDGFADVWKRQFFAWEYKGKHKSLEAAYQQLLQYREDLENPPLLIVCDMDRFEAHTNFTNTVTKVYRFTIAELTNPDVRDILRDVFFDPEHLRPGQTSAGLTEEAARQFARLADMLRVRSIEPRRAAHFLTKMIFCLFAEDVGLLPKNHFSTIVEKTVNRPKEFVKYTSDLFSAMAAGGTSLLETIPFFNGNLFSDVDVLELTTEELDVIRHAGKFDWSDIEPAIFGTLFERSLDPSKRSQIGAHYTHPDDIRAVVEPVLMSPLRRRWEEVRQHVSELAEKRKTAKGKSAERRKRDMHRALLGFLEDLSKIRVLDPACGSGNFLYISMNLLKDLEKEVITFAGNIGLNLPLYQVTPAQLHGIETNTYAHELAQTAIWIGYIQWHRKNGYQVQQNPILQSLDTVQNSDAILDLTAPASPKEPEWPQADAIVGNPPFLGGKLLRTNLGDQYVDDLFGVYSGRVPAEADLVCYWYEKARAMVADGKVKRVGLLATQGIRGGANRRVLERIKESGDIFLAYSDREWVLEGAAVHVSIIGFDNGSETQKILDGKPVSKINANLTGGIDLTQARRLNENLSIAFMGDTKGGPFDISTSLASEMIGAANPHGKSNKDVVKPWVNGLDVTRRPRHMWIIDFGTKMSLEEACLYEAPFEYVKTHVMSERMRQNEKGEFAVKRVAYRTRWWLHMEPRSKMRLALNHLKRFMITPRVSKHRLFVWVPGEVLPDSAVIAIARDDDYTFGILHSRIHELWALSMGTQLESRPRYTPTTTFETFPFPKPTQEHKEAIAAIAKNLDTLRQAWLNPSELPEKYLKDRTLTNLYNNPPTWLVNVHKQLDEAVLDAYGWSHDVSDEDLIAKLLSLNLVREAVGNERRKANLA
jgi:type II restriction/modification system DNA methylase subunit YeeA